MELQHCKGVSTKVEAIMKEVALFLDILNILFPLQQLLWLRLSKVGWALAAHALRIYRQPETHRHKYPPKEKPPCTALSQIRVIFGIALLTNRNVRHQITKPCLYS